MAHYSKKLILFLSMFKSQVRFDELKRVVEEHGDMLCRKIDACYLFLLTLDDDTRVRYVVDLRNNGSRKHSDRVRRLGDSEAAPKADCVIATGDQTYVDMADGKTSSAMALFRRRIRISSLALAKRLELLDKLRPQLSKL
jgi:SCP-2 sterol transfer family